MQTTATPPTITRDRRTRATYTPGYSPNATAFMASRTFESHAAFLLPLLDRGQEVLDVGCGPGTITQGIAEHVLPGRVTAIDRDPSQIARAARLAEGRELTNVRFTTAEADELPFGDASFDLVFAHALFEHLPNPQEALAEMRRVLRPGGIIALGSPDWDAFEMRGATAEATEAIIAYRELQERNGGDTSAGGQLARWVKDAGFSFLRKGERFENYESPMRIATYLALQLDAAGDPGAARALLDWSTEPGAELRGCWKHVIGVKWNP
jgi:ubiquinone/menaquinone biosynthesis C-methylase UbiE